MRLHRSARHYVLEPCASFIAIARLSIFLTCYTRLACAQNYDYTGGVALRYPNDTCPSNTEYIGTSFYPNCCPTWTDGAPSGSGYCCASKGKSYNVHSLTTFSLKRQLLRFNLPEKRTATIPSHVPQNARIPAGHTAMTPKAMRRSASAAFKGGSVK